MFGEKIIAYIKCDSRNSQKLIDIETDLINLCKRFLSGFKIPSTIVFVEELPKTASGKILRRNLRDLHLQRYKKLED